MVESAAKKQGFTQLQWHAKSEPIPSVVVNSFKEPLPLADWVEGLYFGPRERVELPITPQWLAKLPLPVESQQVLPAPGQSPPSTPGAGPIETYSIEKSPSSDSKQTESKGWGPILMVAGGVAIDILLVSAVARHLRKNAKKRSKRKKSMSPTTLALLGAGAIGLYFIAKKPAQKPLTPRQIIDLRYTTAMNAPTFDMNYFKNEIAWLQSIGELGLANNLTLKMQERQRQYEALQKGKKA